MINYMLTVKKKLSSPLLIEGVKEDIEAHKGLKANIVMIRVHKILHYRFMHVL